MRAVHAITGIALLAALAGCDRTGYSDQSPSMGAPAPVQPQPIGGVQSGSLSAPPGTPGATGAPLAPGQFPAAPQPAASTQVASANAAPPVNSLDISKDQMVGGWKATSGGTTCNMFLTLTKFGNASRGGTNKCVGELMTMRAWDVSGKQVVLMDSNGNTIGHLYKTADNQFSGSTSGGVQISLAR